jgi:type IV pilus secretin PilQ/predicted competence protein
MAHKALRTAAIRKWAAGSVAVMATMAMIAAGNTMPTAAAASVRLLDVSTQGNVVVIEASEPAAYTVNRTDPTTLVVDLRNATVAGAASHVEPQGLVSGVRMEQATAVDGVTVARVRVALSRPAEYAVKSARNTIRLELTPAAASKSAGSAPAPAAKRSVASEERGRSEGSRSSSSSSGTAGRSTDDALALLGAETMTLAQAIANGAALAPPPTGAGGVEAIAALKNLQPKGEAPPATGTASKSAPAVKAAAPQARQDAAAAAQSPAAAPAGTGTLPGGRATPALQSQQISVGQEKKFTGHPISMDFQGVDLRSVLRTFAEISGLNMVIDPDVQGTVDIVLTDVPWDQALEVILRGNALDYTVDGTIVRIAKLETLRKEQDARMQLAQSAANAGALAVRTYTLSYAKADQAAPLVQSAVLSQRGRVQIDPRTNTLIITDLPERLEAVNQLLSTLDRPEPQVEIEARIITTSRDYAKALGVQWGFNGLVNSAVGNTPNLGFPNNGSLQGTARVQDPSDPERTVTDGTAVNLGVTDATSAVGLALGAINGAFNLDVALTALERTGKGRILSTPRVTTQNNVEAEITQGVQIPVQTVANETVTVTYKDAALSLKVTPQITAANTVIMQITLENASPGALVNISGGSVPSIDTQRAITRVQVSDGMTTVMGGIFFSREQTTNDKTPLLHRIPLLGWLFKRDRQVDESRELLIFITPRIQRG